FRDRQSGPRRPASAFWLALDYAVRDPVALGESRDTHATPRVLNCVPARWPCASTGPLLLVALDLADRPRRRLVRVLPELPAGTPLPQQVPALIQRLLGRLQLLALLRPGQL